MTTQNVVRAAPRRGLLLVLLAAALWGTSGVATKGIYALSDASPLIVAALRLALGAPLLWLAYRASRGQRPMRIARRVLTPRYHPLLSLTVAVSIGAVLLLAIAAAVGGLALRYPSAA